MCHPPLASKNVLQERVPQGAGILLMALVK